jgi:hypothetical protein
MRYARHPSRRAWAIPITSPLAPEQRLIDIAQMISRAHLANRRTR